MWRCTDYNLENSWKWVAAAENKLTFDTNSLLVFDICSTVRFHGKGWVWKNMSVPSSPCWLLLWTRLTTRRCTFQSLIECNDKWKCLLRAVRLLTPSPFIEQFVSNLHRGRVGQGARWEAVAVTWAPQLLCHSPSVCCPRPLSLSKDEKSHHRSCNKEFHLTIYRSLI